MRTLSEDTSPHIEQVQIELLRQMPPWHKLALAGQLNRMLSTLALNGLRQRHPHASPEELRRRLADIRLGPELAARVYGPLPEERVMPNELNEPVGVTLLVTQELEALNVPYIIGGAWCCKYRTLGV